MISLILTFNLGVRPAPARPPLARQITTPTTVRIPGSFQGKLGCAADWQPACEKTQLTYDPAADIWQGVFELPAGDYEYKVAIDGNWDENYGANARRNGANISLKLAQPAKVRFLYDHKTHWVADSQNALIARVVGSFQRALGCPADDAPACLAAWLQDPDGDGIYTFTTTKLPPGTYDARVAIGLGETSGEGGAANGKSLAFSVPAAGEEIYFGYDAKSHSLTISAGGAPRGNLSEARAHWVARDTIAWDIPGAPDYTYKLHYDPAGALRLAPSGPSGGKSIDLTYSNAGLDAATLKQFPHLQGFAALKIASADLAKAPEALKGQVAVAAYGSKGALVDATSLQIAGALDDLYAYDGPLGVTYAGDTPTLRIWAPTARAVTLHLFDSSTAAVSTTVAMAGDTRTGVWSTAVAPGWTGKYYLYEVEVYASSAGAVVKNLVTDPYSLSLSTNSARSQIVDLADPRLKPEGWDELKKPPLDSFADTVLYELHIRDFSIGDGSVPEAERGTYKAFAEPNSNGMRHLKTLAAAGVTHIHLLPAFDIASIEEDKRKRQKPDARRLAALPPDSPEQQALIAPLRDKDGFNWGYDPYHYTTPEGSYATDPDGPARIHEFREMVAALNGAGLRVVMDVVYNHTSASGQNERSVLDKIVPGYYYRLNLDGTLANSTCCPNTATEHAMMEKLMVDSLATWATAYKVDGFRFDLMGHHMVANIAKARDTLRALTPEKDGVDGSKIYLYGEGWNFGEVADNKRGPNATQANMAGSGVGTFNDRLRDAVRGGGPFGDPQEQGFIDGLLSAPNETAKGGPDSQRAQLFQYSDLIKLGLAGNLRDYTLIDWTGAEKAGSQIFYNGQPAGYTLAPQENVVYISAHDNETLFDAVQLKAPAGASIADRARMADLGLSIVALSQGVPFFHAGDEILRSKSLDRNSYNSGDWFNAIDWTYRSNNWGVGLPPEGENKDRWPIMRPLLANPALKPTKDDIAASLTRFEELLEIRQSSRLFCLRTADEIKRKLTFLNNGPDQIPGLIVMRLVGDGPDSEDKYGQIIVMFNGTNQAQAYTDQSFVGSDLALHPIQAASQDPAMQTAVFWSHSGMFCVPPYAAAVFVGAAVPQLPAQATIVPQPTEAIPEASVAPTIIAAAPTVAEVASNTAGAPTAAPAIVSVAPAEGAGANGVSGSLLVALAVVAAGLAGAFVYFRRKR